TPNFEIHDAYFQQLDNVQYLHVDADFNFSEPVLEALHNGIKMTIVLDVDVYRKRAYLWDEKITRRDQRYELEYFSLSEQYVVSSQHTNELYSAMTLQSAIYLLRDIKPLAVIDNALLSENESYYATTRVRLSLNRLPVPLQLNAFISTQWWLMSDWYSRPILRAETEAQ
ncbi:MAG: DUF4390 domain-containing protein, partial [Thiohalomonadales bacterium]